MDCTDSLNIMCFMMCWWSIDMLVGGYCWYYWGTLIAQFFILSIQPASQPASSLIQFRPAERGAGAYPSFWERCRVCQDAVTWQYKPPLYPYYKSNSVTVCLCTCNESQTKPALNHWWKGPTTVKESSRKCDFMKYIKDKIKRWILHLLVDKNLTAGSFLLLM